MAVDSGACATVASPEDLPNYTVFETPQSKAGESFAAASGDAIPNMGRMKVPILTRDNTQRLMNVTAAPALKPLMSVKQMCVTRHAVIFDDDGSYIMNKMTGEVNRLREEGGNDMLDTWVPPNSQSFGGQA